MRESSREQREVDHENNQTMVGNRRISVDNLFIAKLNPTLDQLVPGRRGRVAHGAQTNKGDRRREEGGSSGAASRRGNLKRVDCWEKFPNRRRLCSWTLCRQRQDLSVWLTVSVGSSSPERYQLSKLRLPEDPQQIRQLPHKSLRSAFQQERHHSARKKQAEHLSVEKYVSLQHSHQFQLVTRAR